MKIRRTSEMFSGIRQFANYSVIIIDSYLLYLIFTARIKNFHSDIDCLIKGLHVKIWLFAISNTKFLRYPVSHYPVPTVVCVFIIVHSD